MPHLHAYSYESCKATTHGRELFLVMLWSAHLENMIATSSELLQLIKECWWFNYLPTPIKRLYLLHCTTDICTWKYVVYWLECLQQSMEIWQIPLEQISVWSLGGISLYEWNSLLLEGDGVIGPKLNCLPSW